MSSRRRSMANLRSRSCSAMPTRGLLVKGENLPDPVDFDGLRLRADRFNGEQLDRVLESCHRNTKPLKERAILGRNLGIAYGRALDQSRHLPAEKSMPRAQHEKSNPDLFCVGGEPR